MKSTKAIATFFSSSFALFFVFIVFRSNGLWGGKDGRAIQLEPWPLCARIADAEQESLWLNDNNVFAENMASVCGRWRMRVRVVLSSKLQNQFNKIAANEDVSMVWLFICSVVLFQDFFGSLLSVSLFPSTISTLC